MKFTARDRAYGLPSGAPGSKTVLRGERVYTRNDMALAWLDGYRDGIKDGIWNYTHTDGRSVAALPHNPYVEE